MQAGGRAVEIAASRNRASRFSGYGPMFHICEMVVDAEGSLVSREDLPYVFLDTETAGRFLDFLIGHTFATGKSGYQPDEGYWWGCDDKAEIKLYRYTVEH